MPPNTQPVTSAKAVCRTAADDSAADNVAYASLVRGCSAARTEEAGDVVFRTYELIENILANLDTKTLLFCQNVSKDFKSVIDRSHLLQQALFFKPASVNGRRFGVDGVNPLLLARPAAFRVAAPLTFFLVATPITTADPHKLWGQSFTFSMYALDTMRPGDWVPCKKGNSRDRMLAVHPPRFGGSVDENPSFGPAAEAEVVDLFRRKGVRGYKRVDGSDSDVKCEFEVGGRWLEDEIE